MSTIRYPMTVAGEAALRDELHRLKNIERPRLSAAIAEARAHGDLRENAEYHAAREQQGMVEARIRDIEAKLGNSVVIDVTKIEPTGKVIFGTTVDIVNLDTDQRVTYTIVGEDEADIKVNKISNTSPIAKALLGKEEGETVQVQTPGGKVEYEIEAVHHR